jgi:hypothetical protein
MAENVKSIIIGPAKPRFFRHFIRPRPRLFGGLEASAGRVASPAEWLKRYYSDQIGAIIMVRMSAAFACVALAFGSSLTASASIPIKGITVKGGRTVTVGLGPQGHRVIVTLQLDSTSSWAYDPASGGLNQLPTPEEQWKPISGIGIVVKKNPGNPSPANAIGDGGFTLPTDLTPGNYDIVISVPAHAISTKGTGSVRMAGGTSGGSKPATLTFHVIVGPTKSAAPQPKSTYLMQENASNNSAPVSRSNVANNRVAAPATGQKITLDTSRPPTVVVGKGSGANSSQ